MGEYSSTPRIMQEQDLLPGYTDLANRQGPVADALVMAIDQIGQGKTDDQHDKHNGQDVALGQCLEDVLRKNIDKYVRYGGGASSPS